MRTIGRAICLAVLAALFASCTKYDHDKPDTPANRDGFKRHIGFAPPKTVSALYYYADEMGADQAFQLGFKADPETIAKITTALGLIQQKSESDVGIGREFAWWKKANIQNLTPYWKSNNKKNYFRYLWYNQDTQQTYYLEFSI